MPRQARIKREYLHVIVRGIGKQILFENDVDRNKYLSLLEKYSKQCEVSILAYCLMENHVHLLIYDKNGTISIFMKKIGVSYAKYYNTKYERTGHLFQDRFKSEIIVSDAHLLTVFRYILNNPYKAGICKAENYPWSSFHEFATNNGLTDSALLEEMIGGKQEFLRFMTQEDNIRCMEADNYKRDDEWALALIQGLLNVESATKLQQYDRKQRDEALSQLKKQGITIRQIERLTGLNRGIIQRAK